MSRKLDASCKKVDEVFQKMFDKGISLKKDKENGSVRWSENTMTLYADMTKAFIRDYHKTFGVADIKKMTDESKINELIQKRVDDYYAGNTKQSDNLKTLLSSLNAFNKGVKETNIFKGNDKIVIGDVESIRAGLKELNVFRESKTSETLRATPAEARSVLENIKNQGYNVATRDIAYHVGKIAMDTGGRISSILTLRAGDFVIDTKRNEIVFTRDKGGLTRTVAVSKETADYLKELKAGKDDNHRVFSSKRADGTFKSVKETRKEVSKIIAKAGEHLTRTESVTLKIKDEHGNKITADVTRKFSTHSFRKSFACDRTAHYHQKFDSKASLNRYVASRVQKDPRLKEKLENVRERINKSRNTDRDLTQMEYAIFFCSVDLGHFRNDVVTQFYTTFKEVKSYLDEK